MDIEKNKNQGKIENAVPEQRYLEYITFYRQRMVSISRTVQTLDFLTTHGKDYHSLSSICRSFTNAVIENFWAQAVIQLYAFYYTPNVYSFEKFFNYIRANWNNIFSKEICLGGRKTKISSGKIFGSINECEQLIKNKSPEIKKLASLRDNVFAHYGKLENIVNISVDELLVMFKVTGEIINKIEVFYDGVITCFMNSSFRDIGHLCRVLSLCVNK